MKHVSATSQCASKNGSRDLNLHVQGGTGQPTERLPLTLKVLFESVAVLFHNSELVCEDMQATGF